MSIYDYDKELPALACPDCGLVFDLVGRCGCPENTQSVTDWAERQLEPTALGGLTRQDLTNLAIGLARLGTNPREDDAEGVWDSLLLKLFRAKDSAGITD